MTDPERWLTSADAPEGMQALLAASKTLGPTAAERTALAGKLGISTSGLWAASALKALLVGAVVAGGAYGISTNLSPDSSIGEVMQPTESRQLSESTQPPESSAPLPTLHPASPSKATESTEKSPSSEGQGLRTDNSPGVPMPLTTSKLVKSSASEARLPSEAFLLQNARASLSAAPRVALAELLKHEQLYPKGVLAEEREVMKVRALSNLGADRAAHEEADKFRKEHPDSVHHVPEAERP